MRLLKDSCCLTFVKLLILLISDLSYKPFNSLMSRIDLVSKNLLTSSFRNFSKKDLKKTTIRTV